MESVPNFVNIAAYGAAGLIALSIVDGIVNLPLLNILIGVPVQIVGATTALALAARYLKDGKDPISDIKGVHAKINKLIPEDLPQALPADLASEWEAAGRKND